jgi:peptide/nickel transport system substrate-binding protein
MDRSTRRAVEEYRREAGPIENNLVDELVNGELSRQEFVKRGAMFGLSVGIMGSLLAYVGEAGAAPLATTGRAAQAVKRGGTIKVGLTAPGASLEPYLLNDGGALALAGIPGEYLTWTTPQGNIAPWLATSWKPNKDATVWTFQLRKGVKFHDGQTMTSKDVVASFKQYVGNKASNAGLSPYFDAAGVKAVGTYGVQFTLKLPIGVFPYLLSQTTYQAIIQRAKDAANPGTWVKGGMIGTGAFKLKSYVDKKSAVLVRNAQWWGGSPPLDGINVTYYQGSAPMVLALRAGQIDLCMQLGGQEAQVFKNNSKFTYYSQPTAAHRQLCMRTDQGVLKDPRVRRAIALTLDRPAEVQKLLLGDGVIGNDNPFWKGFASSSKDVKQRTQNLTLAKQLLQAAGATNLKFNITTWNFLDHPDHAAAVQAYAKQAGIDVGIEIMDVGKYYDAEPAGADYATTTPWLNRTCTLTEYGARGVPNIYISRCYMSTGDWNASHYKNPKFDAAANSYLAAPDLTSQRKYTKLMAGILLNDTPVITDYFINYVTASSSKVKNYVPDGISHVRLMKTYLA